MITGILPNMIPMRDIAKMSSGDRLFYELGYKTNINNLSIDHNWVRTGKFKEIENVEKFIKEDDFLTNINYLNHHNFMMIKK